MVENQKAMPQPEMRRIRRIHFVGIGGAAIIVDCMTDNRVRTVAEVRHAFNKNGGNMGNEGSVAFLFQHCGQFLFAPGVEEDKLILFSSRSFKHRGQCEVRECITFNHALNFSCYQTI